MQLAIFNFSVISLVLQGIHGKPAPLTFQAVDYSLGEMEEWRILVEANPLFSWSQGDACWAARWLQHSVTSLGARNRLRKVCMAYVFTRLQWSQYSLNYFGEMRHPHVFPAYFVAFPGDFFWISGSPLSQQSPKVGQRFLEDPGGHKSSILYPSTVVAGHVV